MLVAWAALSAPAPAGDGEPVERHILALFDSEGRNLRFDFEDPVHQMLEMPLNHLGMVVVRHDIRKGPPPGRLLEGARAVLTCFDNRGDAPDWLWPWLQETRKSRRIRFLHFGDFGPLLRPAGPQHDPAPLAEWLRGFGLDYDDRYVEGPVGVTVEVTPGRNVAFETSALHRAIHRGPRNAATFNRVWLATRQAQAPEEVRTAVVTGPWGGMALDPWTYDAGDENEERRWHLDLFSFFREALGLEAVPAPHPCVLNGRRMFLLHVDGDGFESLSTVRPGEMAGRVFLEEILRRYPLPATVSIIVGGLTQDLRVAEPTPAMLIAREMFALPNVEPASHGVAHPFRWELPLKGAADPGKIAGYFAVKNYDYGPVAEVVESVRFINERLLEGRKCGVMLWTGATNAPVEAIAACRGAGVLNMNGGVFRWDPLFDSIAFVSPWARCVGDEIQVYAGAANENDFEGFFDTMPAAYRHIDTTLERTGAPRILKPANLYVHFYIAEKPPRLKSLHDRIARWAFQEPTAPVFASTYAAAVDAAIRGARLFRTAAGWTFRDFGACRTIRIDDEAREVDFARSRGLLGARRIGGSLYVHLASSDGEVVLARSTNPHPHVEQANHLLAEAAIDARGVAVTSRAFQTRLVVFAGFPPGASLLVSADGAVREERADGEGRFTLSLPPGDSRVEVRLP